MSIFEEIDAKHAQWKGMQPLKPSDENRLWGKLRLDWNYHSNHIEGNTLTYGETELLLIHDQVSGDHGYRNYLEMKAHDLAIEHLRQLVAEDRPLSESDVRDLNQILLKEPFRKQGITPDGQAATIEIVPGQYKEQPNNVRTADGGVFEFAAPGDVPIRMNALLEDLRAGLNDETRQAVEFASGIHHEFVLIHPFGDGNGRTARLLVNYILMKRGYPPIIVPTEEKDRYLAALRQADAGDSAALCDYLGSCSLTALDRGIRAAKGESIEEEDDLAKEIEIFKRRHGGETKALLSKTPETLRNVYEESLRPLFEEFVSEHERLAELFQEMEITPTGVAHQKGTNWKTSIQSAFQTPRAANLSKLGVTIKFKGFKGDAPSPFNLDTMILSRFEEFQYEILLGNTKHPSQLYGEPLVPSVRKEMVKRNLATAFDQIKKKCGDQNS